MEITVTLRDSDFWALQSYVSKSLRPALAKGSPASFARNLLIWIVLFIAILVAFNAFGLDPLRGKGSETFAFVGGMLFASTLIITLYSVYIKEQKRRFVPNADGPILGEHIYRFDENGVFERSKLATSSREWLGILKMVNDSEHIFLMIDNISAYIIPKRAFTSHEDCVKFLATLQTFSGTAANDT